jgi:hypothetical protein
MFDVKYTFETNLWKKYAFHQWLKSQYQILLNELWMCLDFNGFVTLDGWPLPINNHTSLVEM